MSPDLVLGTPRHTTGREITTTGSSRARLWDWGKGASQILRGSPTPSTLCATGNECAGVSSALCHPAGRRVDSLLPLSDFPEVLHTPVQLHADTPMHVHLQQRFVAAGPAACVAAPRRRLACAGRWR